MSTVSGTRERRLSSLEPGARARRRRSRRARRMLPLLGLCLVAFAVGAVIGARANGNGDRTLAERFVRSWSRGDYHAMYDDVDAATQRAWTPVSFAAAYAADQAKATATGLRPVGRVRSGPNGTIVVPVVVQTRIFGSLHLDVTLSFASQSGRARVLWTRALLFPGLRPGERLSSRMALPPRAALLARDGSVLASGPAVDDASRASPLPAASGIIGTTGPIPVSEREQLAAQGVPPDAYIGLTGLEYIFDSELRGRPGGVLRAGDRVLATAAPVPGAPVRTSISPTLQFAAVDALGDQLGGVVALRPSDGEILAVAGLGIDDVQPPGSTFKMVTVTGVLEYGVATPTTTFPYATQAVLSGVPLTNAGSEDCGGTLTLAFAVSCNSVFAPLGARLGAARLTATAESYGFDAPVGVPGAAESTFSPRSALTDNLAVGAAAIGQDEDLASPLQMAIVASTIANGGLRPRPTFVRDLHQKRIRVTSAHVAHEVRSMMIDVVQEGTGTSAAIPGVTVAGKTGTAELVDTNAPGASTPQNTDAWFAAFAPALTPHIAVAVMLVHNGAGGATAAPVARQVLEAALSNGF